MKWFAHAGNFPDVSCQQEAVTACLITGSSTDVNCATQSHTALIIFN